MIFPKQLLSALFVGALLMICSPVFAASGATPVLDLSAYRGKVVYLDFWASWCTPCRASFPWMSEIQSAFAPRGLVVVAVNVDHDRNRAEQFLQDNGSQFQVVFDPKGSIASKFKIKDMPTSILIGRDGAIRDVHSGFFAGKAMDYRNEIEQLLSE